MNGELAVMAALAAFGGRWLRRTANNPPDAPVPALLRGNSSFQYVGSFTAHLPPSGPLSGTTAAASPEEWLVDMHARGTTDLSLITHLPRDGALPAQVAAAFANSGTWALLATGAGAPVLWTVGWRILDRRAPESRIWSLVASPAPGEGLSAREVGVPEARERLRGALHEISGFSERTEEVSSWALWFAKAEALLDDPDPAAPYHRDLLPPDASVQRRQLAAAVVQGWVFGGMGSWNDAGCRDPAAQVQYQRVGANLYDALLFALEAAANGA